MTKNIENIAKIDVKGFQDLCNHFAELEKENKQLKQDNKVLGHELTYFKELCADLEETVNRLTQSQITDPFMKAEFAAEQYESEVVSAMGSYLGDD